MSLKHEHNRIGSYRFSRLVQRFSAPALLISRINKHQLFAARSPPGNIHHPGGPERTHTGSSRRGGGGWLGEGHFPERFCRKDGPPAAAAAAALAHAHISHRAVGLLDGKQALVLLLLPHSSLPLSLSLSLIPSPAKISKKTISVNRGRLKTPHKAKDMRKQLDF